MDDILAVKMLDLIVANKTMSNAYVKTKVESYYSLKKITDTTYQNYLELIKTR